MKYKTQFVFGILYLDLVSLLYIYELVQPIYNYQIKTLHLNSITGCDFKYFYIKTAETKG